MRQPLKITHKFWHISVQTISVIVDSEQILHKSLKFGNILFCLILAWETTNEKSVLYSSVHCQNGSLIHIPFRLYQLVKPRHHCHFQLHPKLKNENWSKG